MMNYKVLSKTGSELRDIELSDAVFGLPFNEGLVWQAVNNELANKRLGTACTKDRGEVHGSNAKPYKQKGTGRARRGDKKSPLLVGGGTIFGPKPRDFSYSIPKKAKQAAVKCILSLKASSACLKIVEDFTVESGKTKDIVDILNNFTKRERTVFVTKDDDAMLKRAGANIPYLTFLSYNRLRAHDLFYGRCVIMHESAAAQLKTFFDRTEAAQ
jgi:large subunit ribosomal protein L4